MGRREGGGGTGASVFHHPPLRSPHRKPPPPRRGHGYLAGSPQASPKLEGGSDAPGTPWHPIALARLNPPWPQIRGGGDATSWSPPPGTRALGGVCVGGYPQDGHLPGCACAPAARPRSLTSRLPSVVPGKADYASALRLSPSPRHLLPPRSSAWHGPEGGGQTRRGSPWWGVGAIPVVGANLHSGGHLGAAPPPHTSRPPHPGECALPKTSGGRKSLTSLPKFHPPLRQPLSASALSPGWGGPQPCSAPHPGESGCMGPPRFPPPSIVGC